MKKLLRLTLPVMVFGLILSLTWLLPYAASAAVNTHANASEILSNEVFTGTVGNSATSTATSTIIVRTPTATSSSLPATPTLPATVTIPPTPTNTPTTQVIPAISFQYQKGQFIFTANVVINRTFPVRWRVGNWMDWIPGQVTFSGTEASLPILAGSTYFCLDGAEEYQVTGIGLGTGSCYGVPPTVIYQEQRGHNIKLYSDFHISKDWQFRWEWDNGAPPLTFTNGFSNSVSVSMKIPEDAKRICWDVDYGYTISSNLQSLPYNCWPTDQNDPVLDLIRQDDDLVFDVPLVITTTYPVTFTLAGGDVQVAHLMMADSSTRATFENSSEAMLDIPRDAVSFSVELFGDYDIPPELLLPDGRIALPPVRIFLPFQRR